LGSFGRSIISAPTGALWLAFERGPRDWMRVQCGSCFWRGRESSLRTILSCSVKWPATMDLGQVGHCGPDLALPSRVAKDLASAKGRTQIIDSGATFVLTFDAILITSFFVTALFSRSCQTIQISARTRNCPDHSDRDNAEVQRGMSFLQHRLFLSRRQVIVRMAINRWLPKYTMIQIQGMSFAIAQ
jgi:hypothetical protein